MVSLFAWTHTETFNLRASQFSLESDRLGPPTGFPLLVQWAFFCFLAGIHTDCSFSAGERVFWSGLFFSEVNILHNPITLFFFARDPPEESRTSISPVLESSQEARRSAGGSALFYSPTLKSVNIVLSTYTSCVGAFCFSFFFFFSLLGYGGSPPLPRKTLDYTRCGPPPPPDTIEATSGAGHFSNLQVY